MPDEAALALGWFLKAESDLKTAQRTEQSEGPFDTACFHAQQAVEKYLKGLLAFRREPFHRTHNLEELQHRGKRSRDGRWRDSIWQNLVHTPSKPAMTSTSGPTARLRKQPFTSPWKCADSYWRRFLKLPAPDARFILLTGQLCFQYSTHPIDFQRLF